MEEMALDVKISYSWTNYCRLCLLDSGFMVPLFEEDGENSQLSQKIETCLQLKTYDGDPLPRRICHKCLFKVNQTYEFRSMALSSYEKLKAHLLPLKHVPEVQQYLEKADSLLNPVSSASVRQPQLSSIPRNDFEKVNPFNVKIKTEKESTDDFYSVTSDSLFSSTSYNSTPKGSRELDQTFPSCSEDSIRGEQQNSSKLRRPSLRSGAPCSASGTTQSAPKTCSKAASEKVTGKNQFTESSLSQNISASVQKCVHCSASFTNKRSLHLHLANCLKCVTCKKRFSSVAEKAVHEAKEHICVVMDFKQDLLSKHCSQCPARFASGVMLSNHYQGDHNSDSEEEIFSHFNVKSSSTAILDVSSIPNFLGGQSHKTKDETEEDCPLSELKFRAKDGSHVGLKGTKCSECSEIISNSQNHTCAKVLVMSYHCSICRELFPTTQVLEEHVRQVHSLYNCSQCSACFDSLKALTTHKRSHGKQSKTSKSLKRDPHLLGTDITSKQKMVLACIRCSEEFEEEDAFILHLYQHATEQSDDEALPKKKSRKISSSKTSTSLPQVGQENGLEHFSVKCDRCHVVCRSKEYYKVHVATHLSKAKTCFPCSGCNQDFKNVEALNRHTCRGSRPENIQTCCLDCGQALVIGEDHICDNKCPMCEKVFKSARGQRLHFVSKHEGNQKQKFTEGEEDIHQDDPKLSGLDLRHSDSEEEQNLQCVETADDSKTSHTSAAEASKQKETCDAEENSFIGGSLPSERLPPDGAPLDEPTPCLFDSVIRKSSPSTICSATDSNSNSSLSSHLWPSVPNELDILSNRKLDNMFSGSALSKERMLLGD